jgi:hypothetical protein
LTRFSKLLFPYFKNENKGQGVLAYACNPSYSGGRMEGLQFEAS